MTRLGQAGCGMWNVGQGAEGRSRHRTSNKLKASVKANGKHNIPMTAPHWPKAEIIQAFL